MRLLCALALLLAPGEQGAAVSGKVSVAPGAAPKKRVKVRYAPEKLAGHKPPSVSPAVVWLEGLPTSLAEGKTAEMLQEGLEFRPRVLAVQAGTTVKFPNGDDLQHNVFSYSKAKRFDLGRYAKGESKDVRFDDPGVVEINCEVHKHMRGFVVVVGHPYFAVAGEDGAYEIPGVPPGKYTLAAWKEDFELLRREIEVTARGTTVDIQIAGRGDVLHDRTAGLAGCCAR